MSSNVKNINESKDQAGVDGRIKEAVKWAKRVAEAPTDNQACVKLCDLYLNLRQANVQGDWIREAIEKDCNLCQVFVNLSTALYEEGEVVECDRILDAVVWAQPGNYEAWNDLGAVRYALKDYAAAEMAFNKALSLKPGHNDAIMNLCLLYIANNQAISAVTTALTFLNDGYDTTPEFLSELAGVIGEVAPVEATRLMERAVLLQSPD